VCRERQASRGLPRSSGRKRITPGGSLHPQGGLGAVRGEAFRRPRVAEGEPGLGGAGGC
jgi:hypothetical protein